MSRILIKHIIIFIGIVCWVVGNLNQLVISLYYNIQRDDGARLFDVSDYSIGEDQFIEEICLL